MTAKDSEVGQVRIPRGATKTILPYDRQNVTVVLRGRDVGERRWDPRYGPPERSGVARVGEYAARELLTAGEVLAVTVDAAGIVSLGCRTTPNVTVGRAVHRDCQFPRK